MKRLAPAANSNDHIAGNTGALIELVEYADYECSYCGRAYRIIKDIQLSLGKEMKFVFRNFPLSNIHPNAVSAAVATEAAALQNKFWEMHDIIFENQRSIDPVNIFLMAKCIGLDLQRFTNDIERKDLIKKLEEDFETGIRSGVNRTPTFFVNGQKYLNNWQEGELLRFLQRQISLTKSFNDFIL